MQGALLGNEHDNPLRALYDMLTEIALKLKTVILGLQQLLPEDRKKHHHGI